MPEPLQIFISYARKDDRTPTPEQQGWVDYFDSALGLELEQRGLNVSLWRDRRGVDPNDFWDEEIQEGLDASRLLISVLSPNYIQRKYCLFELEEFLRTRKSTGQERAEEKVYKVVARPVPHEQHPPPLQGRDGFKFFSFDREKNKEELYYHFGYSRPRDEYWEVLASLARSLEAQIRNEPKDPVEPEGVVYLAEATSDRAGAYRALARELENQSWGSLPRSPLPTLGDEAVRVVAEALDASLVSIHLLGATPGFAPEGDDVAPIVSLQLELAAARARRVTGFRRLIWLPRDLVCTSERQRQLVEGLLSGELLLANDELVREPFQKFIEVVLDSLPGEDTKRVPPGPRSVFVLCLEEDEERALDFRQAVSEAGCEALLPIFAGDDDEREAAEAEDLAASDGVVVVYGSERRERWVTRQLERLDNLERLGRRRGFAAKAVLLAGQPTPRKERFSSPRADVILRAFDPAAGTPGPAQPEGLQAFLDRLTPASEGDA